jgi:predicted small lipoprotein YifL
MIRALALAALLSLVTVALAGCGQKGPLKLPEPPKPASLAP